MRISHMLSHHIFIKNDELKGFKGYAAAGKREFAKRANSEIIKRIFTN